jgi:hypothetical protein
MTKFSCEFINPATDSRMSVIVQLSENEIESVERLRAGNGDADLVARGYALKHGYAQVPKGFMHLRGTERPLRTGEYIEQFLTEMRADPHFADGANGISAALDAIDREADGNADAAAFFECVRWVLERPKPVAEKLDVLQRLLELQGRITINMPIFTGWK